MNVLIINSSARSINSQSRKLTELFAEHWKSIHLNASISYCELGNTDVPHINQAWITAAFKPKATRSAADIERLKTSDLYISELRQADVIVLGAPMYNWSIPSTLKAYIDQILRVNETFSIDRTNIQNPYIGLLTHKTVVLMLSRGEQGYEKGEYNESMNFQSTYLKTVFTIIGISHVHVIAINGVSSDPDTLKKSVDTAHQTIRDLIEVELSG
jgi:FMN-dependent NADH-azoreductase